jgi:thymidine kinase
MLSTHDKRMIPCIQTKDLRDVWYNSALEEHFNEDADIHLKLRGADVILINEGQFFDDLYEVVDDMLNHHKTIYVAGLDGDFERKKFGQILDLVPLCDKVTKYTSLCSQCKNGTEAIFSMRLSTEKQQTLVGSSNYLPVCRKCYNIFIKTT